MRWPLVLAFLAGLCGCLQTDVGVCENGLVCPAGLVCSLGGCAPPGCGDSFVDDDEVCDDGNTADGDGCRHDCLSAEICGNGVVDRAVGEDCEDTNFLNHDGCSSVCSEETARWTVVTGPTTPPRRMRSAMVYDPARDRVILFGGSSLGAVLGDAWSFERGRWRPVEDVLGPAAREGHAVVFDAARGEIVMLNGIQGLYLFSEQWAWKAGTWTLSVPPDGPRFRLATDIVYEGAHERLLMFGGLSSDGQLDDTWVWDGQGWTLLQPELSPPSRRDHAMAYDARHGQVVLFGGLGGPASSDALGDTWLWDGSAWREIAATDGAPPARYSHRMVYDSARGKVVLFGGTAVDDAFLGDTWEWDGETESWSEVASGSGPPARTAHAMVYSTGMHKTVLFGGWDGVAQADTWLWDGDTWELVGETDSESEVLGRVGHAFASEASSGTAILFGGLKFGALCCPQVGNCMDDVCAEDETCSPGYRACVKNVGDAWRLDEAAWFPLGSSGPSARAYSALANDVARGKLVMFGGTTGSGDSDETWLLEGGTWKKASPRTSPPPTWAAQLAYHAGSMRLVLVGGATGVTGQSETWAWDGQTWRDVTPALPLPSRIFHGVAYDARRDRLVVFGGFDGESALGDTWEWDGQRWEKRELATAPKPRYSHAMEYDAARGRVVLYGGVNEDGLDIYDTWELDGESWQLLPGTAGAASQGRSSAMAYQSGGLGLVQVGGFPFNSVAQLRYGANRREYCKFGFDTDGDSLVGCDDPDCWAFCAPACAPGGICDSGAPRCGDLDCNPWLETCRMCPQDCGPCAPVCGDFFCDAGEDGTSCPGDCS